MSSDEDDPYPTAEMLLKASRGEGTTARPLNDVSPLDTDPLFTSSTDPVRILLLVAAASADDPIPSGKALMDAIESTLGRSYSPGTIYPVLDDWESQGAIERRAVVKRKNIRVDNPDVADAALAGYETELEWYLEAVRYARAQLDHASEAQD